MNLLRLSDLLKVSRFHHGKRTEAQTHTVRNTHKIQYLCLFCGRALGSTANILDTKTITGAIPSAEQSRNASGHKHAQIKLSFNDCNADLIRLLYNSAFKYITDRTRCGSSYEYKMNFTHLKRSFPSNAVQPQPEGPLY